MHAFQPSSAAYIDNERPTMDSKPDCLGPTRPRFCCYWCHLRPGFTGTIAYTLCQADARQVVLVMVGLPARGKSLISGKGMTILLQFPGLKLTDPQSSAISNGRLSKQRSSMSANIEEKGRPIQTQISSMPEMWKARKREGPPLRLQSQI